MQTDIWVSREQSLYFMTGFVVLSQSANTVGWASCFSIIKAASQQITTPTNYKHCILPILLHLCRRIYQFWPNFYISIAQRFKHHKKRSYFVLLVHMDSPNPAIGACYSVIPHCRINVLQEPGRGGGQDTHRHTIHIYRGPRQINDVTAVCIGTSCFC